MNKILFREILKSKAQFLAISAVVFAGIAVFLATYLSYSSLKSSEDYYYQQYNFLDYYAEAKSIDYETIQRIREVNGIKKAIGRITQDVGVEMGDTKRISLRLISVPDNKQPEINQLYGGSFSHTQSIDNGCLLHKKFADFHSIKIGDGINVVVNQRCYTLKVLGIIESPEFIYTMRSASSFSLSAEDFGVAYLKESDAGDLLGLADAYNQVHVIFSEGLTQVQRSQIIDEIESILSTSGLVHGVERKDQLSYFMVNNDIQQIRSIAYMFPILFLSTATMMIYAMQRRIITKQRTEIGVIKALGYSDIRILFHYLSYSLMVCITGIIPGIIAGRFLGMGIAAIYIQINHIPVLHFRMDWGIVSIGVTCCLTLCMLGSFLSVREVLRIEPAQAMRNEAPRSGSRIWLEKVPLIWGMLAFETRVLVRNMIRSYQRSLLTIAGSAFTIMILIVSIFFLDSFNYLLAEHFFHFQRQDYKVVFAKPASIIDVMDLGKINGIKEVEPLLEVPCTVHNKWAEKDTMAVGLITNAQLYRIESLDKNPLKLPETGVLISPVLAEELRINTGDSIEIELRYGENQKEQIQVAGLNRQFASFSCYMGINQLSSIMGEGRFATGALLKVDRDLDTEVRKQILKSPIVEALERKTSVHQAFLKYLKVVYSLVGFMILFGSIMGFAIIFNTTVINISERQRELATLKVLGYSRREVARMLFSEHLVLALVSVLPGVMLGKFMAIQCAKLFSNEVVYMQAIIYPRTYIVAVLAIFVFVSIALLSNSKGIDQLDITEVLKNREG